MGRELKKVTMEKIIQLKDMVNGSLSLNRVDSVQDETASSLPRIGLRSITNKTDADDEPVQKRPRMQTSDVSCNKILAGVTLINLILLTNAAILIYRYTILPTITKKIK